MDDNAILKMIDNEIENGRFYIGLKRKGKDAASILKRESGFDGIESFVYVTFQDENIGMACAKFGKETLERFGYTEEKAWELASKNTEAKVQIVPLTGLLPPHCHYGEASNMYAVTNEHKFKGAAGILAKEKMRAFSRLVNIDKWLVIPSSVHEVIIVPYSEVDSTEAIDELIHEVNERFVEERDQLGDHAYIMSF